MIGEHVHDVVLLAMTIHRPRLEGFLNNEATFISPRVLPVTISWQSCESRGCRN